MKGVVVHVSNSSYFGVSSGLYLRKSSSVKNMKLDL